MAHDGVELIRSARALLRRRAQLGRRRGARAPGEAVPQHGRAQERARVQAAREQQRRVQLAPDALRSGSRRVSSRMLCNAVQ